MSTILDALKKVERERESPREQLLHAPSAAPAGRRSSIPLIVTCAAVGLATGAGLALWRNGRPVEVAALPEIAPPPAIDVPAVPPEPQQAAIASATQPNAPEPAPPVVAAMPPASESALEPSPFAPPRAEEDVQVASAPKIAPRPAAPALATVPAPKAVSPSRPATGSGAPADALAAVPPPAPEPPVAPVEAEPPPVPPTVVDTGRSPPGLPRVALSFLQWSADPSRRFAFVSIDGGPSQRVREGDTAGGLVVAEITPTGVQFKRDDKMFTIRPRH